MNQKFQGFQKKILFEENISILNLEIKTILRM